MRNQEKKPSQNILLKVVSLLILFYLVFGDAIVNYYEDFIQEDEIIVTKEEHLESQDENFSDYSEAEKENPNTDSSDEVFTVVEEMPKFEGCENLEGDATNQCTMQKIQSYTAQVEYPQIAIDNDIEGKIYIRFVIDAKGEVSDVKLLRGVDKLLDNAALEHIKNMPKFASPGKQRGKSVKVQYNIPIVFRLG